MAAQQQKATQSTAAHHDEQILVVKRDALFPEGDWQGLKIDNLEHCLNTIEQHAEFHPRSIMETDPTYKQIIPYLIFQHENTFFLMQRSSKASETRLQSKYTLGIGGHVRAEDLKQGSTLFDWAQREFHEEVNYEGKLQIGTLGILNDDSDEVGKVHMGLVLMLFGESEEISVKSELAGGELVTFDKLIEQLPSMETWSQIIVKTLWEKGKSQLQDSE